MGISLRPEPADATRVDPNEAILRSLAERLPSIVAKARAAGETVKDEDIEQFIREETGGRYGFKDVQSRMGSLLGAVGRGIVQGATLNFGDELIGLVSPKLREEMRFLQEADPAVPKLAGELAGGLLYGIGAAGKGAVTAGKTIGQSLLRNAAFGGAIGAAAGAGAADEGSRLAGAAVGGLGGAILGGGAAGIEVAAKAVAPHRAAKMHLEEIIERSGGKARLLTQLEKYRRAGLADDVYLADLSGELTAAAGLSAEHAIDIQNQLRTILRGRLVAAPQRLVEMAERYLPGETAEDRLARLVANRRAWAEGPDGFGGLRRANPTIDNREPFKPLLKSKAFKRLWAAAQKEGKAGLAAPDKWSFRVLHDVKQKLDDLVTSNFKRGRGNAAQAYKELRNALDEALKETVPDYDEAARVYRQLRAREEALTLGQGLFRAKSARVLQQKLWTLPKPLRDEARYGLISEFLNWLQGPGVGAATNIARRVAEASPTLKAKIAAAFGDKKEFVNFIQRAKLLHAMQDLENALFNPRSALARLGQDRPAQIPFGVAREGPVGTLAVRASRRLARFFAHELESETQRQAGKMLLSRGRDDILKTIENILSPIPWTTAAPKITGTTLPYLTDFFFGGHEQ